MSLVLAPSSGVTHRLRIRRRVLARGENRGRRAAPAESGSPCCSLVAPVEAERAEEGTSSGQVEPTPGDWVCLVQWRAVH